MAEESIASLRFSVEAAHERSIVGWRKYLAVVSDCRVWYSVSCCLSVGEHTFLSSPPSQVCRWLSEKWVVEKIEVER